MLAVIKNEARDNDDVANEALIAVGSYIGIYVTIASLPDILIPLGKYLKKLKGRNNISLMRQERALFSSEEQGQYEREDLSAKITDGEKAEQGLLDKKASIQEEEEDVSSSKKVVTDTTDAGLATNN